jgi:hypothetical protein
MVFNRIHRKLTFTVEKEQICPLNTAYRLITYPLSETARKIETETVTHILQENGYYNQQINTLKTKTEKKPKEMRERAPGTHYIGGWVGPRAGLDVEVRGKILCLSGIEPRTSSL